MTMPRVSIDSGTIDALIDSLTRLKRAGGNLDEGTPFLNVSFGQVKAMDLHAQRTALSQIKSMQNALRALADLTDLDVQKLKENPLPKALHSGIMELPDELLARIFELADEDEEKDVLEVDTMEPCIIELSQVCKLFREVALNTPHLWATIAYDMLRIKGRLQAFLSRSKNAPLKFRIVDDWTDTEEHVTEFILAIKPYAHRWTDFRLESYASPTLPFLRLICRAFAGEILECPLLKRLDILTPFASREGNIDEGSHFYLQWNTPALARMRICKFYPLPIPIALLTSLEYVWVCRSQMEEYFPMRLRAFVNASDTLRELKLGIADHYFDPSSDPPYMPVNFPQLTKLSLCFQNNPYMSGYGRLEDVMRTLHLPNLEELSVKISPGRRHDTDLRNCIDTLFSSCQNFPRLANFHLSVVQSTYWAADDELDLSRAFSNFPALRNLTLELPNLHPSFSVQSAPAPLRSLRLIKCYALTDDFLLDALSMIRAGKDGDAFSCLEITNCASLPRSNVEAMLLPKERLVWK